jgi:hypothetical protein
VTYVITEEGIDYILLKLQPKEVHSYPDPSNTIINKTQFTEVIMLNGEETIIATICE